MESIIMAYLGVILGYHLDLASVCSYTKPQLGPAVSVQYRSLTRKKQCSLTIFQWCLADLVSKYCGLPEPRVV